MSPDSRWKPIENPITGERMLFLRATTDGAGALLEVQFDLPPGAAGSPLHRHRHVTEHFEVLDGELAMEVGGRRRWQTLGEGQSIVVPAGTPHSFRNASSRFVTFTTEIRPPERFERFLRTWYGAAGAGLANAAGVPSNPFHLARCLQDADFDFAGVPVPAPLQRLAIAAVVGLGGWLAAFDVLAPFERATPSTEVIA